MSLGHGELALERDDLRRPHGGAHDVPERCLSRGRRDPDARGAAVDVVGEIGGLDVPGQRPDAASLRLGEQRMVRQPLVREQRPQRAGAAAESQRVDRQHRDVRRHVIAGIARRVMLPVQRLAQDHPQRVAGGCAVSRRQHELVAVRMLGAPVVVAEPAQLGPGQVRRDVERRVGQRAAEMPGLGIVAEQGESHAGHVADVFQAAPVVGKPWRHVRPWRRVNTHRSLLFDDGAKASTRSIFTLRRVRADSIIASVTSTTRSPSRPVAAGWPPVAAARWKSSISAT